VDHPASGQPIRLRDYELLELLGQGGMGAVYKALHLRLDKVVALKVLPARRMADANAVSRFDREMKAVGKLDHPHIVRATDAGEVAGMRYLVMEFVDGLDVGRISRFAGPLAVADACEIVRQAAQGLQHVHEAGLVHRDIKPSNLILTEAGHVKILDLGLALLRDTAAGELNEELTDSNQILGTLNYMAPEQCTGSHVVDIRADLYSLAATLYKLLAGVAPFAETSSPAEKMQALINESPESILTVRSDVPEELAAVLHGTLAKDPQERLASPGELAAALAPFARGHDLPTLVRTCRERLIAAGEDIRGEVPTLESLGLDLGHATVSCQSPWPPKRRGHGWLAAAVLLLLLAGVTWGTARMAGVGLLTLLGLADEPPNGHRPAVEPGEVFVLEGHTDAGINLALAADAGLLFSGGKDGKLMLWDLRTRQKLKELEGHAAGVRSVAITPDGRRGLSGGHGAPIRYWDLEKGTLLHEFEAHGDWVGDVAFSPNGKLMASVGWDAHLRVWDLEKREKVHDFQCQAFDTTWARGVTFSPDGRLIATCGNDGHAAIWRTDTGDGLGHLGPHDISAGEVVFSPKGNRLLTGGYDHRIMLWDLETGRREEFRGHDGNVSGLVFTPDGRHFLSSSNDGTAKVWDAILKEVKYTFESHGGAAYDIVGTPDGRYAITSGEDARLRVWRTPLEVPDSVPDYLTP
jgi:hypothetical protein